MKIGDPAPAFAADQKRRQLSQACIEGLDAFRRDAELQGERGTGGKTEDGHQKHRWIWPREGEMEYVESGGEHNWRVYDLKVRGMRMVNPWRETVMAAASTPFVNAPTLTGWPAQIQGQDDDPKTGFKARVDDQGASFATYWARAFLDKLVEGVNSTLVTKPADDPGEAYFVNVKANQVLDAVTRRTTSGDVGFEELRIAMPKVRTPEAGDDPEEWATQTVQQRVLLYRTSKRNGGTADGPPVFRWSVLHKTDKGDTWKWDGDWEELEVRAGKDVTEIPFYPTYGLYRSPARGWPAFEDTASQQAALVRKTMNYDQRVDNDSRNLLAIAGATPGQTKSGGSQQVAKVRGNVIWIPPDATAEHLETSGEALKALREDMKDVEERIRVGNLRPMLSQPSPSMTATEIITRHLTAASLLEMWVLMDIDAYRDAFAMKARLDGLDPEGGDIHLPHDFSLNPASVEMLYRGYLDSGGELVPPEVIWPELARAQLVREDLETESVIDQVKRNIRAGMNGEIVPVQ